MLGAVTYSDWLVLEPIAGGNLSPVRSYISELGALTTPRHTATNVLDLLSGACLLLFAVGLSGLLPATRKHRWGAVALGVAGLATALNGRWPLTCAPSRDLGCLAGGLALHASAQDLAATGLSVVADLAFLASMFCFTAAPATTPACRRAARASRLLLLITAPLTLAIGLLAILNGDVGLPQRLLVLLQSGWITVLALVLPYAL